LKRLIASLFLILAAPVTQAAEVVFSEEERAFILSHGLWPQETLRDPSNRYSGDAKAIALGKALFSDQRLSGAGDLSCAGCHEPHNHFADGLALSMGQERLDRNTLALANLGGLRWYGWGGGSDNLWAQSLRPILDAREMDATVAGVAARVRADADLREGYRQALGNDPERDGDEALVVNLAKALAAYQEVLVTPRTAFDRFRDGLAVDDAAAMAAYPEAAKRELKIFAGREQCSFCHAGAAFSNGEFHDIGRPFFVKGSKVDPGRYAGVKTIRKSLYTRAGAFSDEAPETAAKAPSQFLVLKHRNWGGGDGGCRRCGTWPTPRPICMTARWRRWRTRCAITPKSTWNGCILTVSL
jgi:cytochrome c peroxidase